MRQAQRNRQVGISRTLTAPTDEQELARPVTERKEAAVID